MKSQWIEGKHMSNLNLGVLYLPCGLSTGLQLSPSWRMNEIIMPIIKKKKTRALDTCAAYTQECEIKDMSFYQGLYKIIFFNFEIEKFK